jgi:hypothetical protein
VAALRDGVTRMPANRFIHPRLGHSQKVTLLTDLEFRIWVQYMLSADDFGVMRFSAVSVQCDNDALHARPTRSIQRGLERIVDVGLLVDFEHQARKYVCQLDWHHWQKFNLPSATIHPAPPTAILDRCEEATAALFYDHHPMLVGVTSTRSVDVHSDAADVASTDRVMRASDAPLLTANGKRLSGSCSLRELFAEFWKHYPRKVGKDAAWRSWQKVKPDSELVHTMLAVLAWQRQQDAWVRDGGQYIPHPSTWLNQGRWKDEQPDHPHIADSTIKTARAVEEFLRD